MSDYPEEYRKCSLCGQPKHYEVVDAYKMSENVSISGKFVVCHDCDNDDLRNIMKHADVESEKPLKLTHKLAAYWSAMLNKRAKSLKAKAAIIRIYEESSDEEEEEKDEEEKEEEQDDDDDKAAVGRKRKAEPAVHKEEGKAKKQDTSAAK